MTDRKTSHIVWVFGGSPKNKTMFFGWAPRFCLIFFSIFLGRLGAHRKTATPSLGRTLSRREKWPRAVKKNDGRPKVWKKLYKPPCEKTWFIAKIIMQQRLVCSQYHNATTNHIYIFWDFSTKTQIVHENTNSGFSPCPFAKKNISAQLGGDPPEGCEAIPRASPLGCVTLFT